jgi:hypothetical protein
MKIPKQFDLGGKTFDVKLVDTGKDRLGYSNAPCNLIEIEEHFAGIDIPNSQRFQILLHEFFHCLFFEIGRNDLADDETLVQTLAVLMHQFMRSCKG